MQRKNEVQHVFLVGAKSLGAYGGYETFVYKLTEYHQDKQNIKYHVACKANGDGCMDETKVEGATRINDHEFEFHNAHCFKIDMNDCLQSRWYCDTQFPVQKLWNHKKDQC